MTRYERHGASEYLRSGSMEIGIMVVCIESRPLGITIGQRDARSDERVEKQNEAFIVIIEGYRAKRLGIKRAAPAGEFHLEFHSKSQFSMP